jgi:uncharacterized membrane protein (DUF441 family)
MTLYSWRRVLALFVGVIVALSLGKGTQFIFKNRKFN